jgi:hypothetical protein
MKSPVICAVFVVVTIAVGAVVAEEAPAAPPYFLVVEGEIDKAVIGPWSETVVSLIEAHDAHSNPAVARVRS